MQEPSVEQRLRNMNLPEGWDMVRMEFDNDW